MVASPPEPTTTLTADEVGETWPEALVLWDRDVAHEGWTPAFRVTHSGELSAVNASGGVGRCHHSRDCECSIEWRQWTGDRWINRR
jgi:hypothetical protein